MTDGSFAHSFTVLMSVYVGDDASLFHRAIKSVFDQNIKPNKFIIVCDGPLNTELECILNKIHKYHAFPIKIIRLAENRGLANALNEGLKIVDTEWVARADADDVNRPNRFQITDDLSKEYPETALLGGAIQERSKNGKKLSIRRTPLSHQKILKYVIKRNPFNHMTVAFRTNVVRSLGGYPDLHLREDYALWIKILSAGFFSQNTEAILVDATTGLDMYKRRGGWKYAKAELQLQRYLINYGFKSNIRAFFDGFSRLSVFLAPTIFRKFIYQNLLRK